MEVLVVDDLEKSRVSLARIIAHLGCTPVEAINADDALQMIGERPDIGLVMLRSRKSVVNGYNFIAEMKAMYPDSTAPKVVVVGKEADMPSMLKMLAEGADEYIIKPYDREAIGKKLRAMGPSC